MRALSESGALCATHYTPSSFDNDDDGEPENLHAGNSETGYRKGTVSENKRMTDISGDPDREFAVAL